MPSAPILEPDRTTPRIRVGHWRVQDDVRQREGRLAAAVGPASRTARHDPRWPTIVAALAALRERRRFAVRIVDAECGAGTVLIAAVLHARMLGFTAIEGHGIDGSPALIGRARAAARRLSDAAIGVSFAVADVPAALVAEQAAPADILLWHAGGSCAIDDALAHAAALVIRDDPDGDMRAGRLDSARIAA